MSQPALFADPALQSRRHLLTDRHYLGDTNRGHTYQDEHGVIVAGNPTSRRLPADRWVELIRWCIVGGRNAGSRQWAAAVPWLRERFPNATTVVSYSDPVVGHTGALYRACGWLWAPTWLRLRTPPTGNGSWKNGARQVPKDRWIYLLAPDGDREALLAVQDDALMRRVPWASYTEPRWRRGKPVQGSGGGDYRRWCTYSSRSNDRPSTGS